MGTREFEGHGFPGVTRDGTKQTIPERFEEVASRLPGQLALVGDGHRLTYGQLNGQVNRIAHAIRGATPPGVGCVAVLADHSPAMIAALLGVLKAGKCHVAIHPGMPLAARRDLLREVVPELLLTTSALEPRAAEACAGICDRDVLTLEDVDGRYPDTDPVPCLKPHHPAMVYYTSGTTGRPKGVVKSHRAVMHRVWLSVQHDEITTADRQSLLTHTSFASSEADIFGSLLNGATLCPFDIASAGIAAFRAWVDDERITLLHPPAVLFRRFLSTLEGRDLFPSVRLVALAGDVVLPDDVRRWRRHFTGHCVLMHRFSTTETALLCVARIDSRTETGPEIVAAGRPVADKCLTLIGEDGEKVGEGEIGELVVKSPFLADGYWRRPVESAEAFSPDAEVPGRRIYRTGDLGRFLPDGSFVFLGRRDHQVKVRGFRLDTREIESALLQLDEVYEAATLVRKIEDEPRITAYVVLNQGHRYDPAALRERLRDHLPEWKIPSHFRSIPALPTTPTGKVDRRRLESEADEPAAPARPSIDKPASVEEVLEEIWKATLRVDAVRHDEGFLDLGGDSISMMMALNRIEKRYGTRIAPVELLNGATIRGLAELIRGKVHEAGAVPPPAIPRASPPIGPGTAAGPTGHPSGIRKVSDGYVELLNRLEVDHIFVNPGSDTAPILESIAGMEAEGRRAPGLVLCLHESVAMAAAHGYFMVTGRPQVVLVHVDVGTQNIGANLHNAQRGRAGVVVCAGRVPYTVDCGVPGSRDQHVHWIQEQFNQAGIVQGYVKWHYELTTGDNLAPAVRRAFQVAGTEPAGPVYLSLPNQVLVQDLKAAIADPGRAAAIPGPAADPECLSRAARWLIEAESPLILVGYAGRNPRAVAAMVGLAEALAIPVVETRHRLNFPSSHPLHLGHLPGRDLREADCVLIVDHDVPWIPSQEGPRPGCRIIQVDIDPLKRDIPIWGFPVDLAIQADSSEALAALAEVIRRSLGPGDEARIETRRRAVAALHESRRARWRRRALDLAASQPIAPEWAAHCLGEIIDDDTLVIGEAVTNTLVLWKYLRMDVPGSYFQSQGAGLGWGLGAALGAKLAARSKTVICVVGDGSWLFGSPIPVYWAAGQNGSPFLTVIFNNQGYLATARAILAAAPGGQAARTGNFPACDLPKPPIYSGLAEAMGLWARTVHEPSRLASSLREALGEVRRGRSALVDVVVSSPRTAGQDAGAESHGADRRWIGERCIDAD